MAKKIAKPAPKRPAPRPLPQRRPQPIDMVRDPGFGSAMAQQNFLNSLAELRAKADAERGGILSKQGPQADLDSYGFTKRDPRSPDTQYGGPVKELKLPPQGPQVGGSSRFDDYRGQPQLGQQSTNSTAGYVQQDPMAGMQNNPSIYDSLRPDYSQVGTVPMRSPENPNQNNFGQIAQGIGRLMPQNPQGQQQQMQSYQNFLNQGMNNMASVNQGAAANFANTQPGMQAPQAGIGQTNRPNMPSMGMQQRRPNPPRKFSTVSNSPARFA